MSWTAVPWALLLALLFNGCVITNPAKYYAAAEAKKPYDAVIVPGVPFNGVAWDSTMKLRVHWAVHLYEQGIARNLIFSGGAVYTPYLEANIMSLYAQQLGVPPEHCHLDPIAEHSTENLFYGWRKGRALGFTRMAVATDIFQSKMTKAFGKKMERRLGAVIDIIPVVWDTRKGPLNLSDPVIDPSSARMMGAFVSILDREKFWKRFRGTLGKNVDWEAPVVTP
ncbi:MAG: YdcF family protein [Flavobacteriales bacterium]|nr:MAG: YdcF family protein [Flavobacteriales bacterium]